jgi:hypothetical protein
MGNFMVIFTLQILKECEMFNPDYYLPTEDYFSIYEKALMELRDEDLWIWLMHRAGKSQVWIADKMGVTQSAISHRKRKIDKHFKKRIMREGLYGCPRIEVN